MINELWDIYDRAGNRTGTVRSRGEALQPGEYHLAASLWVVNARGELLIQKRAATKKIAPNKWSITGGAVRAGETSLEGCIREVGEEIGLTVCAQDIELLTRSIWRNLIFDDYILVRDLPLNAFTLQAEEVSEVRWARADEIKELHDAGQFMFDDISETDKAVAYALKRMKKVDLADPFLGCGGIDLPRPQGVAAAWHFIKGLAGNNNPGAMLPFGKLSVCAYSGGYPTGYGHNKVNTGEPLRRLHEDGRMYGFSHIHHDGTGFINNFYNYAVTMPFFGTLAVRVAPVHMEEETASPGYYALRIQENGIGCCMTASRRAALHRYEFPASNGRIAVDFSNDGLSAQAGPRVRQRPGDCALEVVDEHTVTAEVVLAGLKLYFCARFRGDVKEIRLFSGNEAVGTPAFSSPESDLPFGCVAEFGAAGAAEMLLSISPLSMERAIADCRAENRTFDEMHAAARDAWEEALSRIEIETDDPKTARIFYSNLYHTLTKPSDWSGENFIGPGEERFVLDFATLWDQYKTQMPLLFTLYPDISKTIIATVKSYADVVGHLPHQLLLDGAWKEKETVQARALATYLALDAHYRGVAGDYPGLLREIARDVFENPQNADFLSGGRCRYAAQEIDLAEACGLATDLARQIGDADAAAHFAPHAGRWRAAFDADGLVRADSEFYEGSRWNYSFRLLREMDARITLCGGQAKFVELLDRFFGFAHAADTSARFEGFNNETDMETPFAYHWVNRHDRIAEITDACVRYLFCEGRGGVPGNDDSGGLSSLYLWLMSGIFPVSGQDKMIVGAPQLNGVRMRLANGNAFVVIRKGTGMYVRRALLNGRELPGMEFSVREMMRGGELVCEMGA